MEAVFHEIRRSHSKEVEGSPSNDHGHNTQIDDDSGQRPASDHDHPMVTTNNQAPVKVKESYKEHTGAHRWGKAMIAFTMLKDKVAQIPVLKHFDSDRRSVIRFTLANGRYPLLCYRT